MRKLTIIPYVIATFVAGAAGQALQFGRREPAEVTTVSARDVERCGPTGPVTAGTVSFDGVEAAYTEKRYDEAVRLFTSYTTSTGQCLGF